MQLSESFPFNFNRPGGSTFDVKDGKETCCVEPEVEPEVSESAGVVGIPRFPRFAGHSSKLLDEDEDNLEEDS